MAEYLTTEELAKEFRTSPETIYHWAKNGRAPRSVKVGRRRLYERADIDAFVEEARANGATKAS